MKYDKGKSKNNQNLVKGYDILEVHATKYQNFQAFHPKV